MLNIFEKGGQTDEDEARARKNMEDYGADAEEADEQFYGVFRDKEDFAADLVEQTGLDSSIDNEGFLTPDKIGFREWATNLADAMAEDIDEDNADEYAERLGLEDEYEEAEEKGGQAMEDFLDELRQKEAEELYDEFMRQSGSAGDILDLVSDYGMDANNAIDAYLVRVDYEETDALEDDGFAYIEQGGELYVFDSRMARGGMTKMADGGMVDYPKRRLIEARDELDMADAIISRGSKGFQGVRYALERAEKAVVEAGGVDKYKSILEPIESAISALNRGELSYFRKKNQEITEEESLDIIGKSRQQILDFIGQAQRAISDATTLRFSTGAFENGGKTQGKVEIMLTDDDSGLYSIFHKGKFIEKDFDSLKEAEDWARANGFSVEKSYAKGGRPYRNLKLYN